MSATLQGACYYLDVPKAEKLLLCAMADHANDDGAGVWPGNERLAVKTSDSVRNVQRVLARLEEAGLIVRVAHPAGGRGHAVEWALNTSAIYEAARANGWTVPGRVAPSNRLKDDGDVTLSSPSSSVKGDTGGLKGDTGGLKGDTGGLKGDTTVTPTIREPSRTIRNTIRAELVQREPISPTPRPRDPIWDTLVDILGAPSPAKTSLWGERTKWIRSQPDGTPDKIRHVASRIATEWGTRAVTINSIVDHWTRFDADVGQITSGDIHRAEADQRHARILAALTSRGDQP